MSAAMRFGLPGGRGTFGAVDQVTPLDLAAEAEAFGFDAIWLNEEHFGRGGSGRRNRPAAVPLAAAIAARTRRMRVGFSVLLPSLRDPIRLAEEIATLDLLSGRRVNLGVGWPNERYRRGFATLLGMSQLEQILPEVLGLLDGEPRSVDGIVHVTEPAPVQRPHPPVYMAAHDDGNAAWAATQGYALLLSAFQSKSGRRRVLRLYAAEGRAVAECALERFCLAAEADRAARDAAWPLACGLIRRLEAGGVVQQSNLVFKELGFDAKAFFEETAIVGAPDTVATRIVGLRDEERITRINRRPSFWGTCPMPLQQETVRLFARQVMPQLRWPIQPTMAA